MFDLSACFDSWGLVVILTWCTLLQSPTTVTFSSYIDSCSCMLISGNTGLVHFPSKQVSIILTIDLPFTLCSCSL